MEIAVFLKDVSPAGICVAYVKKDSATLIVWQVITIELDAHLFKGQMDIIWSQSQKEKQGRLMHN